MPAGPPPLPAAPWTLYTSQPELQQACQEWVADEAAATATHGHISGWDTSRVDNFGNLFRNMVYPNVCYFNEDIGGWDSSKVKWMERTFERCVDFNHPLVWDTSKVKSLYGTFANTEAFSQPLAWDTSSVTRMENTFWGFPGSSGFDGDIGGWDVSKVTTMKKMFSASSFNQPIGDWDVSSVANMMQMFGPAFNQRIDSWDVAKVPYNDDCQRQRTYASFTGPHSYWSSAVCPS